MKQDLAEQRFGRLTAIHYVDSDKNRNPRWRCRCDCGNEIVSIIGNLKKGNTKSCGCLRKENPIKYGYHRRGAEYDLTGRSFGRLCVIRFNHTENGYRYWLCQCECKKQVFVTSNNLRNGTTRSCGCLRDEIKFKHGHNRVKNKSRTYQSWDNMIQRCTNPYASKYEYYGGRGIKVCDRWKEDFRNFLEDMGERPKGMTLDRINVNGDYLLENCRWTTPKEQVRNRRRKV